MAEAAEDGVRNDLRVAESRSHKGSKANGNEWSSAVDRAGSAALDIARSII
jgi:hypothetical protein